MGETLGTEADKIQMVLDGLSRGMEDLEDLITRVNETSKSIASYWTSDASASFDASMQDFVAKTKEIIPVLESIRGWVLDTAANYANQDAETRSAFEQFIV